MNDLEMYWRGITGDNPIAKSLLAFNLWVAGGMIIMIIALLKVGCS